MVAYSFHVFSSPLFSLWRWNSIGWRWTIIFLRVRGGGHFRKRIPARQNLLSSATALYSPGHVFDLKRIITQGYCPPKNNEHEKRFMPQKIVQPSNPLKK